MEWEALLRGKRVLMVDDEPDVLELLEEDLVMCKLTKASTFQQAKELLETQEFDFAILDIMGVDGYRLLEIANKRQVISIMLTAHALSPRDAVKSHEGGAASYVPKGRIGDIRAVLIDILDSRKRGKSFWWHWNDRFGSYFEQKFGSEWLQAGEFWKENQVKKWEKYFY